MGKSWDVLGSSEDKSLQLVSFGLHGVSRQGRPGVERLETPENKMEC